MRAAVIVGYVAVFLLSCATPPTTFQRLGDSAAATGLQQQGFDDAIYYYAACIARAQDQVAEQQVALACRCRLACRAVTTTSVDGEHSCSAQPCSKWLATGGEGTAPERAR